MIFKDKKVRLGIIAGVKKDILLSPFSAPFGGFVYSKEDVRIQSIDYAIKLLEVWAKKKKLKQIQITLPPSLYHEPFLSKLTNSFFRNNYKIKNIDLNYAFNLNNFNDNYLDIIWRNARKNLKKAQENDFIFRHCESLEDKKKAYATIKLNRELRGFPLKMTWAQIEETIGVIKADFFLLYNSSKVTVASAMVFHINPRIVQVVYWGDLPKFSYLKTMNFLSFKIFEHYKKSAIDIVDIGPSTEDSKPNYGLCEFKESIGCNITTKLTISKVI